MPQPRGPLQRLLIATHNAGKLAELRTILQPYVAEVSSAGEQNLPEPVEDGGTFAANALIKARAACKASGWPALADDSGLCISALNGNPGVETASWTKRGLEGLTELHEAMGSSPDRSATCVCVLALAYPDGHEEIFEGTVSGTILWPPRGGKGFGYDDVFRPDGQTKVYGEMERAEKSALSHRGKALTLLLNHLQDRRT